MAKRAKKKSSARKSKRQKKKRSSKKSLSIWIVGTVVLALALLVLGLWLGRERRPQVPLYEEVTGNGFSNLVAEVELAIYQSLRELGVHESQVQFGKVIHRAQRDKQWDFTELRVSLALDQSLPNAEKLFARNLQALGDQVTWEITKKTGSELELFIKVEEILTHRVAFLLRRKPPTEKPKAAATFKMSIVIDDLGHDRRLAQKFIAIDGPLSFSVLPYGTFSKRIAKKVHQAGRELLLHLPMEPKGYPEVRPGAGALLMNMTDVELVQTLRKNLDSVPYISGVNNHMGSRLCESEQKMILVMQELKSRGLFFLDSRTSKMTKAYRAAQQLKVPSAERNVFLDNIQTPQAIRSQMKRLIQLARLKGSAIGIAHPHEVTLEVLKKDIPKLNSKGVELVPVSQLVHN